MVCSLRAAAIITFLGSVYGASVHRDTDNSFDKGATVLILGGGVAGVIAARTLHEKGITNFKIVEARDELGGRMMSHKFGAPGHEVTIEASLYDFQA
jgi:polyamine oxidase